MKPIQLVTPFVVIKQAFDPRNISNNDVQLDLSLRLTNDN